MPLIVHDKLHPLGELGLWYIEEDEPWFLEQLKLSAAELQQLEEMRGERRLEWLGARQLVHTMSGASTRSNLVKDEHGKPALEGAPWQLSISHSRLMAAAIIAPRPVGVDIQYRSEKLGRIAARFLHPEELAGLDPERRLEHLHVLWGAKEALYKAYGKRQLDFCHHLRVMPFVFSPREGSCRAFIKKEDYYARFQVTYQWRDDYCLVYAIAEE